MDRQAPSAPRRAPATEGIRAMRRLFAGLLVGVAFAISIARADPIRIVAAESVYGDICKQIGGDNVAVVSILTNPDQDPHEFEASASTAREIAQARLVVYNGVGYDAWMAKLLAASRAPSREVLEVARLARKKTGDNPHLWYDPQAVSAFAKALAETLARIDPAHRADYAQRHTAFDASMRDLVDRMRAIATSSGVAVVGMTETEPPRMSYQQWMTMQLDALDRALSPR